MAICSPFCLFVAGKKEGKTSHKPPNFAQKIDLVNLGVGGGVGGPNLAATLSTRMLWLVLPEDGLYVALAATACTGKSDIPQPLRMRENRASGAFGAFSSAVLTENVLGT